jgi:hypothetical protein
MKDLARRRPSIDREDSVYDPRDKYYLSQDDDNEPRNSRDPHDGRSRRSVSPPTTTSSRRPPRSGSGAGAGSKRYYPPSSSRSHGQYAPRERSSSSASSSTSRNSSRDSPQKRPGNARSRSSAELFKSAARCAMEAGAVAALKLRNDPSPWLGAKGTKVATAAIGAALVDTVIQEKYPQRKGGLRHTMAKQATQMAIGNFVMKGAAKGTPLTRTSK